MHFNEDCAVGKKRKLFAFFPVRFRIEFRLNLFLAGACKQISQLFQVVRPVSSSFGNFRF
jgi:hypothetical protein